LINASIKGHVQVCEMLLDRGADINHMTNVCDTHYISFILVIIIIAYCRMDGHH
jgi:hypothetical protein